MNKVCVVTGAGGILCAEFAKEMSKNGYAVALLDINEDAAKKVADEICSCGGLAKAYKTNVLDKACIEDVHNKVLAELGKCTVLINGAGGNSPKATTAHEYFERGDESRDDILTFFNLDKSGFDFVFDLNIKGVLLPCFVITLSESAPINTVVSVAATALAATIAEMSAALAWNIL